MFLLLALSALAGFSAAAPTSLGLKFDKRSGSLPTLTLPYGTWQASSYDADGDVCVIHTVMVIHTHVKRCRYINSPISDLRQSQLETCGGRSPQLPSTTPRSKTAPMVLRACKLP